MDAQGGGTIKAAFVVESYPAGKRKEGLTHATVAVEPQRYMKPMKPDTERSELYDWI